MVFTSEAYAFRIYCFVRHTETYLRVVQYKGFLDLEGEGVIPLKGVFGYEGGPLLEGVLGDEEVLRGEGILHLKGFLELKGVLCLQGILGVKGCFTLGGPWR